jgi:hypothetical protein
MYTVKSISNEDSRVEVFDGEKSLGVFNTTKMANEFIASQTKVNSDVQVQEVKQELVKEVKPEAKPIAKKQAKRK